MVYGKYLYYPLIIKINLNKSKKKKKTWIVSDTSKIYQMWFCAYSGSLIFFPYSDWLLIYQEY